MSLFTVVTKDSVTTITCPSELNTPAANEFQELSAGLLQASSRLYLFDFARVIEFDRAVFRPFVLFFQGLKNKGSFLASINVSMANLGIMQTNGLDSVLSPKNTIDEAHALAGIKPKSPIDVEFINPFVRATQTTLETQANTRVRIGKPFLKDDKNTPDFDIAGVISLTSKAFQGSIALCFPASVFLFIYSNMLGEKYDTITKDLEDAAGELLNIIFGQAKMELNKKGGYEIQKAIPTIVRGKGLEVHHLTRSVAVVLPFETEAGKFQLEVSTELSS